MKTKRREREKSETVCCRVGWQQLSELSVELQLLECPEKNPSVSYTSREVATVTRRWLLCPSKPPKSAEMEPQSCAGVFELPQS